MKKRYKEAQALNGVAEFHETYNLPILNSPTIPDKSRCELRINLLQEELNELKEAIDDNDLIEVADALADLQYVLSGAILEFGLADKFSAIFDEVQRSNLSKTCETRSDAEETMNYYRDKDGTESYIHPKGEKYIVYRKGDNKVLKSIKYSEADIKSYI